MKRFLIAFLGIVLTSAYGQDKPYYSFVNPFVGTGGHGHTYPGVSAPFGMIQLSPDTRLEGWDGCGGYHYSDSVIYGFSHTHLSGTGVPDYGDLLIMPFTGENHWENGANGQAGYGSSFSHSNEQAEAGKYSVFLIDDQIQVDLATTARCGFHSYTYPENTPKKVIIDLEHRDLLLGSDLILLNDSTLVGKRISNAWATEQHFYFVVQFSEAAVSSEFKKNKQGNPSKLILAFKGNKRELKVKVGISGVDIEGAKKNLKAEMPSWNLADYQNQTQNLWNNELGKIEIYTKSPKINTTFYTALYHAYLSPNLFSDVDGRYRGRDQQIHQSKSHQQYTVFSLWDTFRAAHPLYTITQEDRTVDFIRTFLAQYREGGLLPVWELAANETGCMIGYHAVPVIVDAYMKGIRDFDTKLALEAMVKSAEQHHLGLDFYHKRGYISSEDESESVSKTLEYAYDDWCIAIFADSLGEDSIASVFYERAQFYKNHFNAASKFMEPRFNGGWKSTFRPDEVTFDYTEANSWQYSLFAPQDMDGLIELIGGRDSLEIWLDRLFSASSVTTGRQQADITGLIGQYAHGNEPSHHMAYLYNFTNSPWKTQKYVNQILTTLYSDQPDGLSGNEDCGQMSSWYVLSALGFYSYAPGSDVYLTGTPFVDSAKIHLENGKVFTMRRENFILGNSFVKKIFLNGVELDRNFIYHHEIMQGGELLFVMDSRPSAVKKQFPISSIDQSELVPSPVIKDAIPVFDKKKSVELSANTNLPVTIRYTTDGTIPTEKSLVYRKPIKLKASTQLIIRSFYEGAASYSVEGNFKRIVSDWNIKINVPYDNQYAAGGDRALIDQLRGGADFRTGAWQGYYGKDVSVEIDFNKKKKINTIKVGFLQDIKSWIWMPAEVSFMVSSDGMNWFTVHAEKSSTPIDSYGAILKEFKCDQAIETRYLKIEAKNRGFCPDWHLGAGYPSWIFADEILVE
jgi:predicted alpha-1,2-mannosidase